MTTLVRSDPPDDGDLDDLRARAGELETLLNERAVEVARATSDLAAFKIDYRKRVGLLHEQLDDLEHALAEAELGILSERLEEAAQRSSRPAARPQVEPAPRYTSDAVRKLFRDVAKAIHPDLSGDELSRDRRHSLMIEANRAYALGDEQRLRGILQAWENRSDAVQGTDPDATRLRLVRRIAEAEEQLAVFDSELAALKESAAWKMKTIVDEAAAKGKDLVREMIGRVKRDILVARNRLNAIQPPRD